MVLQSGGTITMADICSEFGVSHSTPLNSFYRGGGIVPNSSANNNVPTGGTISLQNFYNASKISYSSTYSLYFFNNSDVTGGTIPYSGSFPSSTSYSTVDGRSYNTHPGDGTSALSIGPYLSLTVYKWGTASVGPAQQYTFPTTGAASALYNLTNIHYSDGGSMDNNINGFIVGNVKLS